MYQYLIKYKDLEAQLKALDLHFTPTMYTPTDFTPIKGLIHGSTNTLILNSLSIGEIANQDGCLTVNEVEYIYHRISKKIPELSFITIYDFYIWHICKNY